MRRLLSHRHGGTILFCLLFLCISTLTRLALLVQSFGKVDWNPLPLLGTFACGSLYDLAAVSAFAVPLVVYLAIVPEKLFAQMWHRGLMRVVFVCIIYVLLFVAAAEWFFWDEFSTRFNFIAVDYLIYTTEVLGNIQESYPMPFILSGLLALALGVGFCMARAGWFDCWLHSKTTAQQHRRWAGGFLLLAVAFMLGLSNGTVPEFANNYNQELARSGPYSFFAAFRSNDLRYEVFYSMLPHETVFPRLRRLIQTTNSTFTSEDPIDIARWVENSGPEKRYNVIQITIESLSASFLGTFGNQKNLTPNLDRLASESIAFHRLYATGTRTDRGMEALTLSYPPTPGRSIVKRPHNENLFTLGSVFRSRGYDTAFIYSGYGYFDNMNYFFGNNGYKVIDRTVVAKEKISFANVWGACDENLYDWVLDEADRSTAAGKPFFHFVMTTSNHRPYTYPDGRIDIPSHTGRDGAVKYTDYAIGRLIREAQARPWFTNTIFVFVADHCAGSAGKTELPMDKYRIPMFIYNPTLFPPRRVETLCSQIDYAPTLLGLMQWSYSSRFYGKDILRMEPEDERALIGNYQKLGYVNQNRLAVLKPMRHSATYSRNPETDNLSPSPADEQLIEDAITYYQTAAYLFHHRMLSPFHDK